MIDRVGERVTMALSLLFTAGDLGTLWAVTGLWTAGAVLLLVGTVAGPAADRSAPGPAVHLVAAM